MNDDSDEVRQNEWELSKENVQPLKKGRIVANLTTALHHSETDVSKLKEQRQAFEYELRMYSGEDPLSVWFRYIHWLQQNFPSGGPETGLQTLLENCIMTFKDKDQYKNDERFVQVWLKLLVFQAEPLEIFNFMMNQGIGVETALFYTAWADELEAVGSYQKAEGVFQVGLSRMAHPVNHLRARYTEFQQRVVKNDHDHADEARNEPVRQSLVQIKGQGKRKIAGTDRQAVKPVKSAKAPLQINTTTDQKFSIFADNSASGGHQIGFNQHRSEYRSVPKQSDSQAENIGNPSQWSKSKMTSSSKSSAVPISGVTKLQNPGFSVHVDEHIPDTPSGKSVSMGVLSECKREKQSVAHDIINRIADSPGKKAMYQKSKVYGGVVELSFEELRAHRYFERKRSKQEIESTIKKQLEMQQMMSNKQIRELQERVEMLSVQLAQQNTSKSAQSTSHADEPIVPASKPLPQKSILECPNSNSMSVHTLGEPEAQKREPSQAVKLTSSLVFEPRNHQSSTAVCSEDSEVSSTSSSGRVKDSLTPNKSAQDSSCESRTPASLTMHSKEAMHVIQGMFNHTLKPDDLGFDDYEPSILEDTRFALKSGPAPTQNNFLSEGFKIFTDSDDKSGDSGPAPVSAGLLQSNEAVTAPAKSTIEVGGAFTIYTEPAHNNSRTAALSHDGRQQCGDLEGFLPIDDDMTFAPKSGSTQKFPGIQPFDDGDMTFNPCFASTQIYAPITPHPEPATFCDDTRKPETSQTTVSAPTDTHGFTRTGNLSTIAEGSDEKSSGHTESTNHFCGHTIPASHLENKTGHTTFPDVKFTTTQHDDDLDRLIGLEPVVSKPVEKINISKQNLSIRDRLESSRRMDSLIDSSSCRLDASKHVIDTTLYRPSKSDDLLSQTIAIDPGLNPFDDEMIVALLEGLEVPVHELPGYVSIDEQVPKFPEKGVDAILLGGEIYHVESRIGEGAFASVFLASKLNDDDYDDISGTDDKRAIKVQKPACPWEFYIVSTVHNRLGSCSGGVDVRPSVMTVDRALFFQDGSCLINQYHPHGSLLHLVNNYKANNKSLPEIFVAYIVVELLFVMEALIECGVIHGDIKPDNVLFLGPPALKSGDTIGEIMNGRTQSVKLVDLGRGIDLQLFPPGTCFTAKVDTSGFQCIEMQTDQPWTHQTDLFGIAGTIHVLIFNQYMKVSTRGSSTWRINAKIPRRWTGTMWDKMFESLLNVESCEKLPDIAQIRKPFEDFLVSKVRNGNVNLLPAWPLPST